MRYRPGHAVRTREKVVEAAACLFRERGVRGASVEQVMREAGLTVGGFYAHFASKNALLSAAVSHAFRERAQNQWGTLARLHGFDWLSRFAQTYLSRTHRDMVDGGCPIPTLGPDAARADDSVRESFEQELRCFFELVESKVDGVDAFPAADRAIATVALCAGGLLLARAVADPALSARILKACRDFARRVVPVEAAS